MLIALLVILIGSAFSGVLRVRDATRWAQRSETVGRSLHDLLMRVTEAENSQRAYLITLDPAYLPPFAQARLAIDADLASLRDAVADDDALRGRIDEAAALVGARLAEMQADSDRAQGGAVGGPVQGGAVADPALALRDAGRGLETMRRLEALDNAVHAAETRLAAAWEAEQRDWRARALRVLLAVAVLAVLLVAAAASVVALYLRQRDRAERVLTAARDEAVAANRAKSRFLAAASHDLRQPLHALNLLLRTLERRMAGRPETELVRNAAAAAASMTRMFDGLLDITRLDAGVIEPRRERVAIADLLNDLRGQYAALAREKGLTLDLRAAPATVETDRTLLESILRNLLTNAINYTRRGSVSLISRISHGAVVIDVGDTGRGIPPGELDRIFDEFHRVESNQAGQGGLGLGLSIVRRLALLLGIQVAVRSTPGQGSVFTLRIPYVPPGRREARRGAAPLPAAAIAGPPPDFGGRTVLLVDNEPLGRDAMRHELTDLGLTVAAAASAEEAMLLLHSGGVRPDAVIVDRDLGGGTTGPELLDRIAARLGVAAPTLVITGATDMETLRELEETGYRYLIKPVDEAALRQALAELLAGG